MRDAAGVVADDKTEPFEAIAVFSDGVQFLLRDAAFELGGDLFGAPFARGGTQQVADGGELLFMFGEPFLLLDGFDDGFFDRGDAFEGGLVDGFVGCLIFRAEPADGAVAFFFGAFGVEGDEVFEDLFVGDGVGPAVGVEDSEVEVIVDLFEGGDQGFVVVIAVGVGEGFACADVIIMLQ